MKLYSLAEIQAVLGITLQAVSKRAAAGRKNRKGEQIESPWVPAGKSGKAALYTFDSLPADIQAAITASEARAEKKAEIERRKALTAPTATLPAPLDPLAVATSDAFAPRPAKVPGVVKKGGQVRRAKAEGDLTDKQRTARDASLILCRAIDDAMYSTGKSAKTCCGELAMRLLDGSASETLYKAWRASLTKPRKAGPSLVGTRRHLERLHALYLEGCEAGDPGMYLVPGQREKTGHDPIHVRAFLMFFCSPNKPDVSEVWRNGMVPWLTAQGLKPPSYSTACAIEKSLAVTVKYRGRMTGSAYRALLPYISRDVSMFKSNDIWVGDGHSFKAKVQSPIHGNAFVPEVTAIIDWVSRKVVGYSVALSESTIAVSDAFRDAQLRTRARPLIYYSDNGSGQTGKHIDHEITGSLARQGIAHETGIPGNPQGRGVIERWWTTVLLPLAATYPTFTGKKADKETVRKISNEVARTQRAGDDCRLLPSFGQFLIDLEQAIERYNSTHLHRDLNGMTPNQAYEARLDPDSIGVVSDAELEQLWMPEEIRTPQRGVIELFSNKYFLSSTVSDLAENEMVRVRFDIHRAEQVWVYNMEGRFIGKAEWNGNRKAAFPVTYVESKRQERANGIKGRAQQNIDRANSELIATHEAQKATSQIVIGGQIISHESISSQVEPVEVAVPQAKSVVYGELPRAREEIVNTKPPSKTIPRTERPVADNYAEWLDLKARKASGEVLTRIDDRFIDSWPDSNQGKAYLKFLQRTQESRP